MADQDALPYWQVNVPEDERTAQCPDYLLNLSEKDRGILSTPNSEYVVQTWDQVVGFVKSNHLELFQRWPSDLRRYRAFIHKVQIEYTSVTKFILHERLHWEAPVVPRGAPWEYPEDIKILYNDWPYGIDPHIVHLVVWTKFAIEEDPVSGDLTDRARSQVEAFVTQVFRARMPNDKVSRFTRSVVRRKQLTC